MNVELKIGKVISAEKIEGSEKLLKLFVDIGNEERQILAGIGEYYSKDDIEGREVAVVTNLDSKKIFGHESQGMILAADIDGEPVLLKPDKEVRPGSRIR